MPVRKVSYASTTPWPQTQVLPGTSKAEAVGLPLMSDLVRNKCFPFLREVSVSLQGWSLLLSQLYAPG